MGVYLESEHRAFDEQSIWGGYDESEFKSNRKVTHI